MLQERISLPPVLIGFVETDGTNSSSDAQHGYPDLLPRNWLKSVLSLILFDQGLGCKQKILQILPYL